MAVPFWTRGDLNAFFGLGINMLVNVLVLAGLCIGVVNMAPDDVYRVVLPALGIELLIGNLFYFYLARRLAMKERRTDVTAMPYGPSVPHMFIVTLVIMLPTYLATKDPVAAWMAGLAWAFIIGVIILIGAFVGPDDPRTSRRARRCSARSPGISLAFISMRPAAQMWGALWIALPVFMIIIAGFVAGVRLPGNFPVGLAALLVGSRDRLDRRLHGARRGRRRRQGDRDRHPVAEHRPADRRPGGHLAAARDRDPARHLQLHRGDEQRGVAPRRRATTTTSATCCWPTAPAPSSAPRSARRSRPPSTSATRAGRPPADASPTRWRPAS